MTRRLALALLLFALTGTHVPGSPASSGPPPTAPLELSHMGIMYVGGDEVAMSPQGARSGARATGAQTQIAGQAPVHYLVPAGIRHKNKLPVVMAPGMGLTSYLYLATPDGRPGWAEIFARSGHPVYVFDEPYNAISGFNVAAFNTNDSDAPQARFMLWPTEMIWRRWGIGPKPGVPYQNCQYPTEHIRQLYASMTPVVMGGAPLAPAEAQTGSPPGRRRGRRFAAQAEAATTQPPATATRNARRGGARRLNSAAKVAALLELLKRTGPAVLILHSASGNTGFEATRRRPDLVRAIVALEVTGSPTDVNDIKTHFADKRFIALFGDHLDTRRMDGRLQNCRTTARLIQNAGGRGEVISLTENGIRGNTHLMMQDKNNDKIARMVIDRLKP